MKFYEYIKELYTDNTEGFKSYDGGDLDDSFQDDLSGFFETQLIYNSDIEELADQYGADIITAAMRMMAAEKLNPANYTTLEKFINLAFRYIEENHYNELKEIFKNK